DIALRILRDGDDVVRLRRDLAEQIVGLTLVVERRVWQAQRHEIVNCIDIARSFGTHRHLVGAMKDVGRGIETQVDEAAAPRKIAARVGEQVARDEQMVMHRQAVLELVGNDGAGQIDRARLYPERAEQLIAEGVPNLLWQRHRRGVAGLEEGDFAQQQVRCRSLRRSVDDAHVIPEIADDLSQHTGIGRDAGAALEREIEAVKIDAPAHRCSLAPPDAAVVRRARPIASWPRPVESEAGFLTLGTPPAAQALSTSTNSVSSAPEPPAESP